MSLALGSKLGPYEILGALGAGGMGVVYKARDTRLDRLVAIKILSGDQASADADRRRRFMQEARAASALNHPGIVTIHDIATEGNVDFIVMEYVQGKTVEQLIERKALTIGSAAKYAARAAEALAKAHGAGIVHCDLKPSNIMVTDDGLVKILDFGVAKLTAKGSGAGDEHGATTRTMGAADSGATADGRIVGTAAYMSPEQATGQRVDSRSDVFSFGAVLYEMVTGVRAFSSDSAISTLAAVVSGEPRPPSAIAANLPRDLERVILRCLRKDPSRRFQHIGDVAVELEDVVTESGTRIAAVPPRARAAWGPFASAAAIGVLGLVAVGTWVAWSSRRADAPAMAISPLTTSPGDESQPGFSPDGTQVAFSWTGEQRDNTDIYIKRIDTEAPLRLTTDPGNDIAPAWSPDGGRIAFIRPREGRGAAIYVTAPVPGSERRVVEYTRTAQQRPASISWTADGAFLVVAGGISAEQPNAILAVPASGGEPRPILVVPEADGRLEFPTVSPDGRLLAYSQCKDGCDLHVLEIDQSLRARGEVRALTGRAAWMIFGVAWTPDSRSIVWGSAFEGRHLWRMAVSGGEPERLEVGTQALWPALPRTGNRLAYMRVGRDVDLWKFEGGKGPIAIASSSFYDGEAQLSPDGTKIAFSTDRSGRGLEVWVATADGNGVRRLTDPTGRDQGTPRWSPDGRRIAYDAQTEDGVARIYVIDADGGARRQLTKDAGNLPSWSRDGKFIYFASSHSGRSEVWRIPADGGDAVRMTDAGGSGPWESWDGATLYYYRPGPGIGRALYARSLAGGPERQVLPDVIQYFPTKDGIYYALVPSPAERFWQEIRFLSLASGKSETLYRFESLGEGRGLSVSPDGKTIVYGGGAPSRHNDLMLVENFR